MSRELPPEGAPEGAPEGGAARDYASTRLIAYLGNKRALLPFLASVFDELEARASLSSFLDPFAGSGAVSRLARSRGLRVAASDAEDYSYAVNACWLGVPAEALPGLFPEEGGLEAVLGRLNRLHPAREDEDVPHEPYIARHYAPASTEGADWRRERLFYTRENAVFLDRAREAVERLRPAPRPPEALRAGAPAAAAGHADEAGVAAAAAGKALSRAEMERALLLGPLVYEAATHANTSGVFKACHKGFGGHGRDALGRIMAPMRLEPPLLWKGPGAEVARSDAAAFCAGRSADLCYLDPPYNQHQYGSNYHLLNALARWEKPPVSEERLPDGSLRRKAGIDPGWARSRSAFCSRTGAAEAFRELLAAVDARFIVLSYNDSGIVPPEELYDLLSDRAAVSIRSSGYVSYRGGRQSAERRLASRELLFVAERSGRVGRAAGVAAGAASAAAFGEARSGTSCAASGAAPEAAAGTARGAAALPRDLELAALKAEIRLSSALASALSVERLRLLPLRAEGAPGLYREADGLVYAWEGGELLLPTHRDLLFAPSAPAFAASSLPASERESLAGLLEPLLARDNAEAAASAALLLEEGASEARLQRFALSRLRKLAHPKYRDSYEALFARLEAAAASRPSELTALAKGLSELSRIAEARFAASPSAKTGE